MSLSSPCSHGPCGPSMRCSKPAADRCLQLRTVDVNDLSLVRPIFRATHQACAHRVFAHIFPFLRVAFVSAQHVIEESFLPNLYVSSRQHNRFAQRLLGHSNPSPQNEIRSATNKQMYIIRHDHIATNRNPEVALGFPRKENERRMNLIESQACRSRMRAKGDEIQLTAGVRTLVSPRNL